MSTLEPSQGPIAGCFGAKLSGGPTLRLRLLPYHFPRYHNCLENFGVSPPTKILRWVPSLVDPQMPLLAWRILIATSCSVLPVKVTPIPPAWHSFV